MGKRFFKYNYKIETKLKTGDKGCIPNKCDKSMKHTQLKNFNVHCICSSTD